LIDDTWLREITDELSEQITANQVSFAIDLQSTFSIDANPKLFKVLIQNLINNAVACSFQGKVTLQVNTDKLEVIDSGVGLDAKPRGYEGFGIGLVLVEDICRKYGWHFSLVNNSSMLDKTLVEEMKAEEFAGCRASVTFKTQ
jgi:signal transduction histidine kinase